MRKQAVAVEASKFHRLALISFEVQPEQLLGQYLRSFQIDLRSGSSLSSRLFLYNQDESDGCWEEAEKTTVPHFKNICFGFFSVQPGTTGEQKTKPTQNSVRELRGLGLSPDLVSRLIPADGT